MPGGRSTARPFGRISRVVEPDRPLPGAASQGAIVAEVAPVSSRYCRRTSRFTSPTPVSSLVELNEIRTSACLAANANRFL